MKTDISLDTLNSLINISYLSVKQTNTKNVQFRSIWKCSDSKQSYTASLDKKFDYQNDSWMWYKNLNIPDLFIKTTTESYYSYIGKQYAQVRCIFLERNSTKINEQQIRGSTSLVFEKNIIQFTGMKFTATSYPIRGQQYYFAIVIHEFDECKKAQVREILISDGFKIDSRRKTVVEEKSFVKLFEPCMPEAIERNYIRIRNSFPNRVDIEDNLEGLYNYYATPTIRYKQVHPFFLLLKFPNSVRLYYNHSIIACDQENPNFFTEVQSQIFKKFSQQPDDNEELQDVSKRQQIREKVLIIQLRANKGDPHKQQIEKISKFISQIQNNAVYFQSYQGKIDTTIFTELTCTANMKNNYKLQYSRLYNIYLKQKQMNSRQLDGDQFDEMINEQEKFSKCYERQVVETNNFSTVIIQLNPNSIPNKSSLERVKCIKFPCHFDSANEKIDSEPVASTLSKQQPPELRQKKQSLENANETQSLTNNSNSLSPTLSEKPKCSGKKAQKWIEKQANNLQNMLNNNDDSEAENMNQQCTTVDIPTKKMQYIDQFNSNLQQQSDSTPSKESFSLVKPQENLKVINYPDCQKFKQQNVICFKSTSVQSPTKDEVHSNCSIICNPSCISQNSNQSYLSNPSCQHYMYMVVQDTSMYLLQDKPMLNGQVSTSNQDFSLQHQKQDLIKQFYHNVSKQQQQQQIEALSQGSSYSSGYQRTTQEQMQSVQSNSISIPDCKE